MKLSDGEWGDWFASPCTQQFLSELQEVRQELMEDWANGRFPDVETSSKALGGAQMVAQIVGQIMDCQAADDNQEEG